jgi:uroporphyrinogen-III synthase
MKSPDPGSRALDGKRIVVTRATALGGQLAEELRSRGAIVIDAPVTMIRPMDPRVIDRAVKDLPRYDWLILTSQTGVRFFWESLERAGLDARALDGVRVAVIGPATSAALRARGIVADTMPDRFVGEALLAVLASDRTIHGSRVLYAAAADARDVVPTGLRALGATVDIVEMYKSIPDPTAGEVLTAALDGGEVDLVTFASPSAVDAYAALVGPDRASKTRAVSIGPITSAAARAHSIIVVAEAAESTVAALVEAAHVLSG